MYHMCKKSWSFRRMWSFSLSAIWFCNASLFSTSRVKCSKGSRGQIIPLPTTHLFLRLFNFLRYFSIFRIEKCARRSLLNWDLAQAHCKTWPTKKHFPDDWSESLKPACTHLISQTCKNFEFPFSALTLVWGGSSLCGIHIVNGIAASFVPNLKRNPFLLSPSIQYHVLQAEKRRS